MPGLIVLKFDLFDLAAIYCGGKPDMLVRTVVYVWFIYKGGIVTLC